MFVRRILPMSLDLGQNEAFSRPFSIDVCERFKC